VVEEMRALANLYNPDTIWFADDTFTMDPFWIASFSDKVSQCGDIIPFRCFTRADRVSPEMLAKLKTVGCRLIHMGVESGSQRVLDKMSKGQNIETIKNASTHIHNAGIDINYFIMFGYPGEKLQDIRATEKLIQETKPESIGFSIAYPIPGTDFHKLIENSLDKNIESLWEKTTKNIQKMFPTEFPLLYYRLTIQHIQQRNMRRNSKDRGLRKLNSEIKILFLAVGRWVIERIWLSRNFLSFVILGSRR
jgi:anaerobic magnesium-protoporphyrin IX monomethyl ester cyclase